MADFISKTVKSFISLELRQGSVMIAWLSWDKESCRLLKYAAKQISFNQQNHDEIKNFISTFISENAIAEKEVYVGFLDPDNLLIRNLVMPAVPKEEIKGALSWQLKENESFDMEGAFSDWRIRQEFSDENNEKKRDIIAVIAKPQLIQEILAIVNESELSPLALNAIPFNYENILANEVGALDDLVAVLDIDQNVVHLSIFKDKLLRLVRMIPFSYNEYKAAPAQPSRYVLDRLVRELNSSFKYFNDSSKSGLPTKLYLAGPGAGDEVMCQYLAKELAINVENFVLPTCFDVSKVDSVKFNQEKYQLVSLLAASLADNRAVNLLPRDIKAESLKAVKRFLVELAKKKTAHFVLFAILAGIFFFRFSQISRKKELVRINAQLAELSKSEALQASSFDDPLFRARGDKIPLEGLLLVIANVLPPDAILSELEFNQTDKKVILKGSTAELSGEASIALTKFMEKLEETVFIKEARLISLAGADQTKKVFKIECDLIK